MYPSNQASPHAEASPEAQHLDTSQPLDTSRLIAVLFDRVADLEEQVEAIAASKQKPNEDEGLMDVKKVAAFLGVSTRTVRNLINDGQIRPIRVGRQLRFSKGAIDAYVRRQVES
jgi:excisionase family DNA binding protein